MITRADIQALVQLLNTRPMTLAEQIWCRRFIGELEAMIAEKDEDDARTQ